MISELIKDEYTLGRAESCEISVTHLGLEKRIVDCISKMHFKITRERIKGSNNVEDIVIYIEDLSQNGTFVNKTKVGKNRRVVLENNDVISLAQAKFAGENDSICTCKISVSKTFILQTSNKLSAL